MLVKIIGDNSVKTVEYTEPRLISDILYENGFVLPMPCAGNHTCGKCKVEVKGAVSAPTAEEIRLLVGDAKNKRLSCMAKALGDCEIILPQKGSVAVLLKGVLPQISLEPMGENYGFAVDIGTTTVASYFYDLKTGKLLGEDAFLNPQSSSGADVISRIESALGGNAKQLAEAIRSALLSSFNKICAENNINPDLVDAITLTGNTTMMYLLLGENVEPLSKAPFEIENYLGGCFAAQAFGFKGFSNATVYIPRTISAFVGSDITCTVLSALSKTEREEVTLIIDIGTNGEMALVKGENTVCCSTAAGPAFEGTGIAMGTIAADGAIDKVYVDEGKIKYSTIGNQKPIGICGSGLIDAIAVFLEIGLVDETGCIDEFNEKFSEYLTDCDGNPAVKIGDSGILLTQKDIRTVQLAKAAICAGIYSLVSEMKLELSKIDRLMLAGGFGSYIDAENAGRIGLIPSGLSAKTVAIGNAAGMGAAMILLSNAEKKKSFELAVAAKTVNLSTSAFFMDKYVECMMF